MKRLLLSVFLLLCSAVAEAKPVLPPALREVGFDQHLGEQIPLELTFQDESDHRVRLADYFHDRPVILVLAYYRCPMLCTQVLNGLTRSLLDVPLDIGRDFQIVTVSFDAREKPPLAAAKKKNYLERYGRPGAADGWHFLTGEEEAIHQLTQAVGFRYSYDSQKDQFAHASGIMLLTPEGKISHYFYDVRFPARDLRLGLVEASAHRIGSPVDTILLYCFHYDPAGGRYGPTVMNFVRLGGVLTLLGIGLLVGRLWWQEGRKARLPARV